VLHPSNFVQLIQFWLPRSEKLEESIVDSLRIPLFFQSFDQDDEKATLKVLEALSRYENLDDLTEPTLKLVLANKVLRRRILESEASNDEAFQLVRDELLSEHKQTVGALADSHHRLSETESILAEERLSRENSEKRLGDTAAKLGDTAEKLGDTTVQLGQKSLQVASLELRVSSAEKQLNRVMFCLYFLLAPLAISIVFGIAVNQSLPALFQEPLISWVEYGIITCVVALPFATFWTWCPSYVQKTSWLNDWKLSQFLAYVGTKTKMAILGLLVLIMSGIFQGAIWDLVKPFTPLMPK